jgi:hypothetical protein
LTDKGVLKENELRSANRDMPDTEKEVAITAAEAAMSSADVSTANEGLIPDLVEQSVWGIDCYTRRNIITCIEKDLDPETAVIFVEKWLLPAINACPAELAYDLANAAKILEGLPLQNKDDANVDTTAAHTCNKRWERNRKLEPFVDWASVAPQN